MKTPPHYRWFVLALMLTGALLSRAAEASTTALAPLEQRVADLESYIHNQVRQTPASGSSRVAGPGPGHSAWILSSAALVLFMTVPGLALFFGGMVRSKNILSIFGQLLGIAGMVTLLWWVFGYSAIFDLGGSARGYSFIGGLKYAFLTDVGIAPNTNYASWISQSAFCVYQLMFAVITPCLIVGAVAERMKFAAILFFSAIWTTIVYLPLAHMVWGADGLMNGLSNAKAAIRAVDFAGGTVVHMSSGWSALLLCAIVGRRRGYKFQPIVPHNVVFTAVGTGMLWVGWYGFNAGSALAADGVAATAFMNTTLAAAISALVLVMLEWCFFGKPTVLGMCTGIVSGLVTITPACGFVSATGAVLMGIAGGLFPLWAVYYLKPRNNYDDSLDSFGIHAVGGTLGAMLTGFLAADDVHPALTPTFLASLGGHLWVEQLKAVGVTILLSLVGTAIAAGLTHVLIGLRLTPAGEQLGADLADLGEEGYAGLQTLPS